MSYLKFYNILHAFILIYVQSGICKCILYKAQRTPISMNNNDGAVCLVKNMGTF